MHKCWIKVSCICNTLLRPVYAMATEPCDIRNAQARHQLHLINRLVIFTFKPFQPVANVAIHEKDSEMRKNIDVLNFINRW